MMLHIKTLPYADKTVLRGKFIAPNVHVRNV